MTWPGMGPAARESYCPSPCREDWGNFKAPSPAVTKEFSDLLAACMKRAVAKGLDIGVLAHLDNAAVGGA